MAEEKKERMKWFTPRVKPFVLEGFPFIEEENVYRRFPINTDVELHPAMERLAWDSAGGKVRFHGIFKKIAVRVRLMYFHNADHANALGGSGFDCYADDGSGLRYYASGRFDRSKNEYETVFFELEEPRELEVVINFPCFNQVKEVLFGFDWDAVITAPKERSYKKRIAMYGASITQGGCASRPGMITSNILSRRLDAEVINFGFDGIGSQFGVGEAYEMRKLDNAGIFIIHDNCNSPTGQWVADHLPEFMRILREGQPETPIVLLTAAPMNHEIFRKEAYKNRMDKKQVMREFVEAQRAAGDENIYFLDYEDILGKEWMDSTVDGCHPTDLGFLYMADGLQPVIEKIIF